jgi:glutamine synthetase
MATLDIEILEGLVGDGEIDTVLCVFPDLQGRLMGKRVTGKYFVDDIVGREGLHACLYLLALDMEMEPRPGYTFANWETGYGDFRLAPDMATLRPVPWLDKTAMVVCDVLEEHEDVPVEVAPRQILKRQIEAAKKAGYTFQMGSEIEFYLFKDGFDEARRRAYKQMQPQSEYIQDYHILQTTKDEWIIRQIRRGMDAAGIPVEFSKGEFGRGQNEINLRYADPLEMADRHTLYKNGVKEICALNDISATFMAKWSMDEAGSSCHIHTSLWDAEGREPLMWDERSGDRISESGRRFLGGVLSTAREMCWMYAPTVNSYKRFQAASWAPTAIAIGHDNRTCGLRLVGEGDSFRVESRIPGADANPYFAFAATIAGGLHGLENDVAFPGLYVGNAYEAADLPRVPFSLHEAIDCFRASEVARCAFGDEVFEHLVHTAVLEQFAFDNEAVTDWELMRYFERI